ncbi:unnamed protein product [Prunus armeniaca]
MDDNDLGDIRFDPYEFANVIGDGDQPLYPDCRDLLPEENTLPSSMYEAKKTLSALGMSYEKIHTCPNDCILWKEGKDSIWKKGVPAKVVWYFPQIPRFKKDVSIM